MSAVAVPACLRALRDSAISASVSTSFASAIQSNFRPMIPSSILMRTSPSSIPSSSPLKRLRPSISSNVSSLHSHPSNRSKSLRRVRGRSMPGEETSSAY